MNAKSIAVAIVCLIVLIGGFMLLPSGGKDESSNDLSEKYGRNQKSFGEKDLADAPVRPNGNQAEKNKEGDALMVDRNENMISENRAIEIAKKANSMEYATDKPIKVTEKNGKYIVIFPFRDLNPGERGPDYAAKITIDSHTGEILEILGGS